MQEPVLRSQSYNVVFCIIADDLYGTRLARVISLVTRLELKINVIVLRTRRIPLTNELAPDIIIEQEVRLFTGPS